MSIPVFWLVCAAVTVLLYFIVILVDNIVKGGNGVGQRFWKRHIVDDFPYPDICWTCNLDDCSKCPELARATLKKQ